MNALAHLGLAFAITSLPTSAQVILNHDAEASNVQVQIRGDHFTTYHYGDAKHMPYLWPVRGEGGVGVTRNFPMGTDEPAVVDHPHHLSLYLTYGDVNGADFWHADGRNSGTIRTVKIETGQGDDFGWIRAHHQWIATADGKLIMEEKRELRFHDAPATARVIDIITTFKATQGDVTFGDTKEGMLAVRMAPALDGDRGGILTNAQGAQGEKNVYGKPSPWMDYTGHVEGHGKRGIAVFDHPANSHSAQWHVRNYGLAALNPFGTRSVARLDATRHTLESGDSLTFRYRILIHSGSHEEADIAGHYAAFIAE